MLRFSANKILLPFVLFIALSFQAKSSFAQCTLAVIDQNGDTSTNATFVNCMSGTPPNVTLSFQNVNAITGPASINWGDGVTQNFPGGVPAGALFTHIYASAVDSFLITITQVAPACVIQAHFINERSVIAQISPLNASVTRICAPNAIQFVNKSLNASPTTTFILNYGDNQIDTFDFTNAGDTITHIYQRNTVNCNTVVTLTARNACTGTVSSSNIYGPIQIYDLDSAIINSNKQVLCYPDTNVIFTNASIRNCVTNGNTQQRFERWRIIDFKGPGVDSVTDWIPWPPTTPLNFNFPGAVRPRTFCVILEDSSFCGIDSATRCITIIDPPVASFTSIDTVCGGTAIAFTNTTPSAGLFTHAWSFGLPPAGTSTQQNPSFTFTNNGATPLNFTVQLIVTNPGGFACRDTVTKVIVVIPRPTANFSQNGTAGNISACDSVLVTFADLSTNANILEWDFDNNGVFDFTGAIPPPRMYTQTTTINLRVTATNGCVHSRTRTVTIFRTPVANYTTASVCVNAVASFSDASTAFPGNAITTRAWNFDDPASGVNNTSTQTNPTHVFASPGIYDVRLIVNSANGCPDTIIQFVNVEFPPTANFNPAVLSGCSPLTLNLNNTSTGADPSRFVWRKNDTVFSTAQSPIVTYINNKSTNDTIRVKLRAETTFGCRDSIVRTIIVFPNPAASFSANAFPSCNPSPINFVNTTSGGVSFAWDFDDGTLSALPNPIHQFANTTNQIRVFNVRMIATSANGCTDTATLPVLVYPDQTFNITTNVDSGCSPLLVQFPSFPGVSINSWDFGDTESTTAAAPAHTYLNLTNVPIDYQARAIVENAFGCRDTIFKTIRVHPVPTANFTATTNFGCEPLSVVFSPTAIGATEYRWYFGGPDSVISLNTNQQSFVFRNTGTAEVVRPVTLRVFNGNNCVDEITQNITVYPSVTSQFTIDSVACSPYIAQADNRSLNANRFYWFLDGSLVDSVQNKQFIISNSNLLPEEHIIRLQSISIFGCTDEFTDTITVFPSPAAQFSTDVSSGCQPLTLNFTNQSTPGVNYSWDYGDGNSDANNAATFSRVYTNAGSIPISREIRLAVQNVSGCVDTFRRTITVFPLLQADFALSDTQSCSPLITQVTNLSRNSTRYAWFVDNVLVDTTLSPVFTLDNNTLIDRVATIRLQASSSFGCTADTSFTVRILPRPNASFLVANPVIQWPLNTFTIVNQNVQAGFNYAWDFGDGNTSTAANPGTHSYDTSGIFTIQLVVSNAQCSDTITRDVVIQPPVPVAQFLGSAEGCAPLEVTFTNTSLYADDFTWNFGDGNTSNEENPSHVYRLGGTYSVSLIAIGLGGQAITVKVDSIVVRDPPSAFFISQPRQIFIPSDPVVVFNLSNNANQFWWDFGDGFTSTDVAPEHYYTVPGDYTIRLIARNEFGCLDTFSVLNAVRASGGGQTIVPNAFTPDPNGSGGGFIVQGEFNNDVFHPVVQGADTYLLKIYNRWGELLFESNDVNIGWDGYYRGSLCKQDVYVWKVDLGYSDGRKESLSGDVVLLR